MKLLFALLGLWCAGAQVQARDLHVTVIGGTVESKDTIRADPYMSVSVCRQKARTPHISLTLNPVWNWNHVFKNVAENCRIKFHLYDADTLRDDTIGEQEHKNLAKFLAEGAEERTLVFGKYGKSQIKIRVKYV